jgi:histidine triad (HIT) family protein
MKQLSLSGKELANCVFCKIINRELESYVVFEDKYSLAFLDKRPLFPGHCLLIPKEHYETLIDLPVKLIKPIFFNAKIIAEAVEIGMKAEGSFIAINNKVSQSIPHLHIHIVPRKKKDGLKGFFWPRHNYKDQNHVLKTCETLKKLIKDKILKKGL